MIVNLFGRNWTWALGQMNQNMRVCRAKWSEVVNVYNTRILWVEKCPISGLSWYILRNGNTEVLLQEATEAQKSANDWQLFAEKIILP